MVVGTFSIAAMTVFRPVRTRKETAHLVVLAFVVLRHIAYQINQLVRIATFAMPFDRFHLGRTQSAREAVGKETFGDWGRVNITEQRKAVYKLFELICASLYHVRM